MTDRAVRFIRAMAPYEGGDIAGFPALRAQSLVDRHIAEFYPPAKAEAQKAPVTPIDPLDAMTREQLIAHGKEKLGLKDEPGAEVTDEMLRDAIRGAAKPAPVPQAPAPAPPAPQPKGGAKK